MNDNNQTIFAINFNRNCIQKNFTQKFDYKIFLDQTHNSYKIRRSVYINILSYNNPQYYKLGCFHRNNNNFFLTLYVPRIQKIYNNENEICSTFIRNLQLDIGTNNVSDTYTVLANLYESFPPYENDSTLEITFYHLLCNNDNNNNNNNLNTYPTYCYINKRVLRLNLDYIKLFLSYIDINNDKLEKFMKQFIRIIEQKKYCNIIDNTYNFSQSKYNSRTHKMGYNMQVRNVIINLVQRCKVDGNNAFLYSNLGKQFYDTISEAFTENNNLIDFLNVMLFKDINST